MHDQYLGTWLLVPELSLYAAGTVPESGTYEISEPAHGQLHLAVTWRMAGDTADRATQFGGRSDGAPIGLPAVPGAPDAFTLTRIDERTLDSAAMLGERQVAYARRVVSKDGAIMAVMQESINPAGERIRNFQVYRRFEPKP